MTINTFYKVLEVEFLLLGLLFNSSLNFQLLTIFFHITVNFLNSYNSRFSEIYQIIQKYAFKNVLSL